jgi:hypothetical protein
VAYLGPLTAIIAPRKYIEFRHPRVSRSNNRLLLQMTTVDSLASSVLPSFLEGPESAYLASEFQEDALTSTTLTLRGTICKQVRERTGFSSPANKSSSPPSDSDQDSSSQSSDKDSELSTSKLQALVDTLPETMEEDSAMQLLNCLESYDASASALDLPIESVERLVQTTVNWTNQIVKVYANPEKSATFVRKIPLPLSCLALVYKLSSANQATATQESGSSDSSCSRIPTVSDYDIASWIDNSDFEDALSDCALKWFCFEYQQSTGIALKANLLDASFQRYNLALMDPAIRDRVGQATCPSSPRYFEEAP